VGIKKTMNSKAVREIREQWCDTPILMQLLANVNVGLGKPGNANDDLTGN
jgi:hypothetical protein